MRLAAVDWAIVAAFMAALAWSAWGMRRHATSVSGFLSANRLAGRYLLVRNDREAVCYELPVLKAAP